MEGLYQFGVLKDINHDSFMYFKNEGIQGNKLGIRYNKIFEVPSIISNEAGEALSRLFDDKKDWKAEAFHNGYQDDIDPLTLKEYGIPDRFFDILTETIKQIMEFAFKSNIKLNSISMQTYSTGAFVIPHSDNSFLDGSTNGYDMNKYSAIIYLNEDYSGGELYFPQHDISISPNKFSCYIFPGGQENIHGVKEITSGTRHILISMWDNESATYSQEELDLFENNKAIWANYDKGAAELSKVELALGMDKI